MKMKKGFSFLREIFVVLFIMTGVLFAAETGGDTESISAVLKVAGLEVLKYAAGILIPAIFLLIGRLILHFINKIDNETFRGLAIQAVLFAEDKLGADTNLGKEKMRLAVDFLVKKTKMPREQAEEIVRAAYQNVFVPFGEKQPS